MSSSFSSTSSPPPTPELTSSNLHLTSLNFSLDPPDLEHLTSGELACVQFHDLVTEELKDRAELVFRRRWAKGRREEREREKREKEKQKKKGKERDKDERREKGKGKEKEGLVRNKPDFNVRGGEEEEDIKVNINSNGDERGATATAGTAGGSSPSSGNNLRASSGNSNYKGKDKNKSIEQAKEIDSGDHSNISNVNNNQVASSSTTSPTQNMFISRSFDQIQAQVQGHTPSSSSSQPQNSSNFNPDPDNNPIPTNISNPNPSFPPFQPFANMSPSDIQNSNSRNEAGSISSNLAVGKKLREKMKKREQQQKLRLKKEKEKEKQKEKENQKQGRKNNKRKGSESLDHAGEVGVLGDDGPGRKKPRRSKSRSRLGSIIGEEEELESSWIGVEELSLPSPLGGSSISVGVVGDIDIGGLVRTSTPTLLIEKEKENRNIEEDDDELRTRDDEGMMNDDNDDGHGKSGMDIGNETTFDTVASSSAAVPVEIDDNGNGGSGSGIANDGERRFIAQDTNSRFADIPDLPDYTVVMAEGEDEQAAVANQPQSQDLTSTLGGRNHAQDHSDSDRQLWAEVHELELQTVKTEENVKGLERELSELREKGGRRSQEEDGDGDRDGDRDKDESGCRSEATKGKGKGKAISKEVDEVNDGSERERDRETRDVLLDDIMACLPPASTAASTAPSSPTVPIHHPTNSWSSSSSNQQIQQPPSSPSIKPRTLTIPGSTAESPALRISKISNQQRTVVTTSNINPSGDGRDDGHGVVGRTTSRPEKEETNHTFSQPSFSCQTTLPTMNNNTATSSPKKKKSTPSQPIYVALAIPESWQKRVRAASIARGESQNPLRQGDQSQSEEKQRKVKKGINSKASNKKRSKMAEEHEGDEDEMVVRETGEGDEDTVMNNGDDISSSAAAALTVVPAANPLSISNSVSASLGSTSANVLTPPSSLPARPPSPFSTSNRPIAPQQTAPPKLVSPSKSSPASIPTPVTLPTPSFPSSLPSRPAVSAPGAEPKRFSINLVSCVSNINENITTSRNKSKPTTGSRQIESRGVNGNNDGGSDRVPDIVTIAPTPIKPPPSAVNGPEEGEKIRYQMMNGNNIRDGSSKGRLSQSPCEEGNGILPRPSFLPISRSISPQDFQGKDSDSQEQAKPSQEFKNPPLLKNQANSYIQSALASTSIVPSGPSLHQEAETSFTDIFPGAPGVSPVKSIHKVNDGEGNGPGEEIESTGLRIKPSSDKTRTTASGAGVGGICWKPRNSGESRGHEEGGTNMNPIHAVDDISQSCRQDVDLGRARVGLSISNQQRRSISPGGALQKLAYKRPASKSRSRSPVVPSRLRSPPGPRSRATSRRPSFPPPRQRSNLSSRGASPLLSPSRSPSRRFSSQPHPPRRASGVPTGGRSNQEWDMNMVRERQLEREKKREIGMDRRRDVVRERSYQQRFRTVSRSPPPHIGRRNSDFYPPRSPSRSRSPVAARVCGGHGPAKYTSHIPVRNRNRSFAGASRERSKSLSQPPPAGRRYTPSLSSSRSRSRGSSYNLRLNSQSRPRSRSRSRARSTMDSVLNRTAAISDEEGRGRSRTRSMTMSGRRSESRSLTRSKSRTRSMSISRTRSQDRSRSLTTFTPSSIPRPPLGTDPMVRLERRVLSEQLGDNMNPSANKSEQEQTSSPLFSRLGPIPGLLEAHGESEKQLSPKSQPQSSLLISPALDSVPSNETDAEPSSFNRSMPARAQRSQSREAKIRAKIQEERIRLSSQDGSGTCTPGVIDQNLTSPKISSLDTPNDATHSLAARLRTPIPQISVPHDPSSSSRDAILSSPVDNYSLVTPQAPESICSKDLVPPNTISELLPNAMFIGNVPAPGNNNNSLNPVWNFLIEGHVAPIAMIRWYVNGREGERMDCGARLSKKQRKKRRLRGTARDILVFYHTLNQLNKALSIFDGTTFQNRRISCSTWMDGEILEISDELLNPVGGRGGLEMRWGDFRRGWNGMGAGFDPKGAKRNNVGRLGGIGTASGSTPRQAQPTNAQPHSSQPQAASSLETRIGTNSLNNKAFQRSNYNRPQQTIQPSQVGSQHSLELIHRVGAGGGRSAGRPINDNVNRRDTNGYYPSYPLSQSHQAKFPINSSQAQWPINQNQNGWSIISLGNDAPTPRSGDTCFNSHQPQWHHQQTRSVSGGKRARGVWNDDVAENGYGGQSQGHGAGRGDDSGPALLARMTKKQRQS